MKIMILPGLVMVFGALAMPALAQQEMQTPTALQPSQPQSDEMRADRPAADQPTGQPTDQPTGQMAGEQAASDPAVPGQVPGRVEGRNQGTSMKDRTTATETKGAMSAANPAGTKTARRNRPTTNNNNLQDPTEAEKSGNGQAPTGADASQPARSTQQTPGPQPPTSPP